MGKKRKGRGAKGWGGGEGTDPYLFSISGVKRLGYTEFIHYSQSMGTLKTVLLIIAQLNDPM